MRNVAVAFVLAIVVFLTAAPGASAGTFYSDDPGASFSGFDRATSTYTIWNSSHTAQYTIGCLHQGYFGTKPSGTSSLLDVDIYPNTCSVYIGGVKRAVSREACNLSWQFGVATYNALTGAGSGQMANCQGLVFHIQFLTSCTVSYGWVGSSVGSLIQNRDALDTANTTHTSAGGMRVKWANFSMPYTTDCPGVQTSTTGQSSGEAFIPGVWAGP